MFQQRKRTVTATTTAAGVLGLWRMSAQSVRIRIRQRIIRSRRDYVELIFTQVHSHALMTVWILRNWRRIWFSDESRFHLQRCDGGTCVYSRPCLRTGS